MNETLMKTEYSTAFDEKRKGLIEQSYYKYGPARMNFPPEMLMQSKV